MVKVCIKEQRQGHIYDPAIPFPGIYLDKTITQKDTCNSMFIAALFTRAKIWKQPKCLSTDECIKKRWYIYVYTHAHTYIHTMEYYLAIKKK